MGSGVFACVWVCLYVGKCVRAFGKLFRLLGKRVCLGVGGFGCVGVGGCVSMLSFDKLSRLLGKRMCLGVGGFGCGCVCVGGLVWVGVCLGVDACVYVDVCVGG